MAVKRMAILLVAIFLFMPRQACYPFEWRELHEKADKYPLSRALSDLKEKPESEEALYTLGLIYLNLDNYKEAQDAFNKIISLNPSSIEAKWGVAEILRRRHSFNKAEEILNGVIKSDRGFSPAYISLAYIKYTLMHFEDSAQLAYKVIKQGRDKVDLSNYVRAYLIYAGAKGMIAHQGGLISKLINGTAVFRNLKKAEKLEPDSAQVMFGLGSFYLLAPVLAGGNIDKAEAYLTKAIKVDPFFADAYVRLAQVYKEKGDLNKYNLYMSKALEIDPRNELALDIKKGICKFICVGETARERGR